MPTDAAQQPREKYRQLRSSLEAGRISHDQFTAELGGLTLQDSQGTWWSLDPQSGTPLYYDGARWAPLLLPFSPAGSSAAPGPPRLSAASPSWQYLSCRQRQAEPRIRLRRGRHLPTGQRLMREYVSPRTALGT